jgi:type II secretory pathway pseudopilin PulG
MAAGERGLSLVEATIVLAAAAILTGVAAPSAARVIDRAKVSRAIDDAEAIKAAIDSIFEDLNGYTALVADGADKNSALIELAVSDGDIPSAVSATGDNRWRSPVSATPAAGFVVTDFLERHLVTNTPFGNAALAYPLSGGATWRGTYLNSPVDADPWGNRYGVNTRFLNNPAATENDVIVLSAGPDEEIGTAFQQDGQYPGDDDIIVMVRRDKKTPVP